NERGIERDDVRITNSVRCRPPDNRDPHKDELENCREYLVAEIETLEPDVICTLGRVPTSNLLGMNGAMRDVIGEIHETQIGSGEYDVIPCYHPAAMLYDSSKEDDIDRVLEQVVEHAQS
ncbi:MAG: uracil-DNA glycosylase, partial [Halobacteria archaeon]|nr:uracil-DNA glycosylase [Halobacteria archaeon]